MEKYYFEFSENVSKYMQIYMNIKEMIRYNKLIANEKLLPIRKLATLLGVNISTVIKSYEILEIEGYIYKKIGSGCYVSGKKLEVDHVKSDTFCIGFDMGTPSKDMFPVDEFKKAINMALEKEGNCLFDDYEQLGNENLRKELCTYLKTLDIKSSFDRIQIISGAQQGIDIICKGMMNYADTVILESPTYSGAIEVFKSRGCKIIQIPMLDDGIDIGILKVQIEKAKPRLIYVMPNFQNPTGITYSTHKKKKLISLANEYDFYIVEDDFLSDFKFYSADNKTLRHYDEFGRVIYIKSFSKLLMPGLRIGFIEMPHSVLERISLAKHFADISTSGLVQKFLHYYISGLDWMNHLKNIENIYKIRFDKASHLIENSNIRNLAFSMPNGGINFFFRLPLGYSSIDFKNYLLNLGVSILDGNCFFNNSKENRFFRINIAFTNETEIEKGINVISDNLDSFFEEYKNKIDFYL